MSENNYIPLDSDEKILEKFMKILKFYNEIIKSSPLIVSDQDYLVFKKQKVKYNQETKKLEELIKPTPRVDFNLEIESCDSEIETHELNRYTLNIPKNKKTRFNIYILKKINDLENDLEELQETLDFFT